jgi:hypothetical protein
MLILLKQDTYLPNARKTDTLNKEFCVVNDATIIPEIGRMEPTSEEAFINTNTGSFTHSQAFI